MIPFSSIAGISSHETSISVEETAVVSTFGGATAGSVEKGISVDMSRIIMCVYHLPEFSQSLDHCMVQAPH